MYLGVQYIYCFDCTVGSYSHIDPYMERVMYSVRFAAAVEQLLCRTLPALDRKSVQMCISKNAIKGPAIIKVHVAHLSRGSRRSEMHQ